MSSMSKFSAQYTWRNLNAKLKYVLVPPKVMMNVGTRPFPGIYSVRKVKTMRRRLLVSMVLGTMGLRTS
jgi:hypothetical protein